MGISKAVILPLFSAFVVPALSVWSAQGAVCSTPEVCSIKAQLQKQPDYLLLRDLAEKGSMGREAGAVVTALLDHPDWAIRKFNEPPIVKFAECVLVKRHTDNWKIG